MRLSQIILCYRSSIFAIQTVTIIVLMLFFGGCGPKKTAALTPTLPPQTVVDSTPLEDSVKILRIDPEVRSEKPRRQTGWIRKATVNVRSSPTTTAPIVARLTRGSEVALLEKSNQWWQMELSGDEVAYIHESMVSLEQYMDPWTQFKLGCRLADTTLQIIVGATEIKDSVSASAALTVSDDWSSLSKVKKQRIAQAAFAYWKICLQRSGYDVKGAGIVLRDVEGGDLLRISGTTDKTVVEFLR